MVSHGSSFDRLRSNMEATGMDPMQRHILETSYEVWSADNANPAVVCQLSCCCQALFMAGYNKKAPHQRDMAVLSFLAMSLSCCVKKAQRMQVLDIIFSSDDVVRNPSAGTASCSWGSTSLSLPAVGEPKWEQWKALPWIT